MDSFADHVALLIDRGGYVMVPLLALSVISLTLIIERIWFWSRTHRPGRPAALARLNDALRTGHREAAFALSDGDRSPYGPVARRMLEHGSTDAVAIEAVEVQRPRLDRFMVTLSTIITAAPLLGILGTVVGIIQSFRLLEEQNTLTDPREVAGGIAAALLTTALGLIVALMTLFPYMIFRSHAGLALGRLESLIAAAQQGATAGVRGGAAVGVEAGSAARSKAGAAGAAPAPGPSQEGDGAKGSTTDRAASDFPGPHSANREIDRSRA